MEQPIKILHIDLDFNVTYIIYRTGISIYLTVPLKKTINLLKTANFDLILSEPHNKAILNNQHPINGWGLEVSNDKTFLWAGHGRLRKIR